MRSNYATSSARKRALVRAAKSKPCVDCLAAGFPDVWPLESKQLDHLPEFEKQMVFTNTAGRGLSTTRLDSYFKFSIQEITDEISHTETVCANHHFVRTVTRMRRGWQQEAAGQGVLTEVVPAPPRHHPWYELLLRHNPRIWD